MNFPRSIILLGSILFSTFSFAQEFRNIQLKQRGDFVDISFDLAGVEGRTYTIRVFSTHNDGTEPLEFVTGDVGEGIVPGEGKEIVWNANLEVGNKNITVRISLEGNTDPPFINILEPSGGKLKKGKQNRVSWEGESDDRVRIELLKAGKSIQRLGDVPNDGSFNWAIPKDFDSGKDYQLRISNLSNSNEFVTSGYFAIGSSMGMGPKIGAAAVVVAGVVYFLTRNPPTEDPISLPPRPE